MRRTWTDEQLTQAVADSESIREVLIALNLKPNSGGAFQNIRKRIAELGLDTVHFTGQYGSHRGHFNQGTFNYVPAEAYLKEKTPSVPSIRSSALREKILSEGLLPDQCDTCKLTEWQGKPIPLELHHKDGNHNNNEMSNLCLLCPNCHAQTKNYGSKNTRRYRYK